MQQILKEWKTFVESTNKYNRVVLNEIQELNEVEVKKPPLSEEEIEIIKRWGGLEGESMFLGSGTMGSAYLFGDKVCKITSDDAEAMAAAKIAGMSHPNVYKIRKVGQRQRQFTEMPNQRYVIIYDLVGDPDAKLSYPPKEAQDIIQSLHNTAESIKYNWTNNFPALLEKAAQTAQNEPSIFDIQIKGGNYLPRLEELVRLSGMNSSEGKAFMLAWMFVNGYYGDCMDNAENVLRCLDDKRYDYVDQVCKGLTFLSQNGIMFKDLKTTNVLSLDDGTLVIIDIGKSVVRGGSAIFDQIK